MSDSEKQIDKMKEKFSVIARQSLEKYTKEELISALNGSIGMLSWYYGRIGLGWNEIPLREDIDNQNIRDIKFAQAVANNFSEVILKLMQESN